jgi:hypothetical protein
METDDNNLPPDIRTEDEQFYDTEADEEHLELTSEQLSGTKEAQEDPPEDETHSKRAKTATATDTLTDE